MKTTVRGVQKYSLANSGALLPAAINVAPATSGDSFSST